jgi:hypothetical protein
MAAVDVVDLQDKWRSPPLIGNSTQGAPKRKADLDHRSSQVHRMRPIGQVRSLNQDFRGGLSLPYLAAIVR